MTLAAIIVAVVAFSVAAAITRYEHNRDGWWGQRIGRTRWRRANLPAGGALMFAAAVAFPSVAAQFLAAAVAMSAAAVAGRFIDPLPRA